MTNAERGLVAGEGVDEGSADSTAEGIGPVGHGDVLGELLPGGPADDGDAAPPVDMESSESRAARDQAGSGQQLSSGEG